MKTVGTLAAVALALITTPASAQQTAASGLVAVTGEHYAGGHWLGSFATYLTTRRGIGSK